MRVIASPRGEAKTDKLLGLSELQVSLDALLALPTMRPLFSRERKSEKQDSSQAAINQDEIQAFGTKLFQHLFIGEIENCYRESLAKAGGLHIRLRFDDESMALSSLPWEMLFDPKEGQFLVLSQKSSLIRYPEQNTAIAEVQTDLPLNILGFAGTATGCC